nr:MAG TPA: hypothetical protein [Caudoviricetes sp.]
MSAAAFEGLLMPFERVHNVGDSLLPQAFTAAGAQVFCRLNKHMYIYPAV